ncbi:Ankyrin repeat domain-containing protein 60 [Camelus dromedarius]|uniref:Ankyrin repeat domain-containing protein 60 n=1 Tax=Camelus dromedarius TaxID=9838 RepID=A0A5N4CUL2_CAMDR|nr:Ankyrin repeat domain-containing protein 60 [Camelus dromedarius]
MRVLLEDSEEMFRVTNCRSDMTVRELKEELDLMAGIPFNLQRLQFLDQGGPCPTRFPATCAPYARGAQSLSEPRRGPSDVRTNPKPLKPQVEKRTLATQGLPNSRQTRFTLDLRSQADPAHSKTLIHKTFCLCWRSDPKASCPVPPASLSKPCL